MIKLIFVQIVGIELQGLVSHMSEKKCEKCGEVATSTSGDKWYCNTHGVDARMRIKNNSRNYEKLKQVLFIVGGIFAIIVGSVVLYDLFA